MSFLFKIIFSNPTTLNLLFEQSNKVRCVLPNIYMPYSPYHELIRNMPKYLPHTSSLHSSRSFHTSRVTFLDIRYKDYLKKVNEGMKIVDVRNPSEIKRMGGVKGSFEIPLEQLEEAFMLSPEEWKKKFKRGKPSEDTPIMVICSAGVRSKVGVKILEQMGYQQPLSYRGGYKMFKDKK